MFTKSAGERPTTHTKERILIRCDASLQSGTGHVMRCLMLARALRGRGAEVVFACRKQPGDRIALLLKDFVVLQLPPSHRHVAECSGSSPRTGRDLYASWLGCSEEQDAADCLAAWAAAALLPPTWLVLDHYALTATWQQLMRVGLARGEVGMPAILVIDDLADRCHEATVLIDPNRCHQTAEELYQDLLPDSCCILLGPAYALLHPLYPQLQPVLPVRTRLHRVLLFFGGVDLGNYSSISLLALNHPQLRHLEVDVVVVEGAPHYDELLAHTRQRPNTTIHVGLSCLAGLMARADLALGAAGTASWERACLGLPSLVVPVAENQRHVASELQVLGVARCLDLHAVDDPVVAFQEALLDLLDRPDELSAMSESCLQLGDGRGLARVSVVLCGPSAVPRLRPAQPADLWLYHWWASDSEVRRQSFNTDPIPLEQHRQWYTDHLSSPLVLMFVLVGEDDLPLGQIRFERDAASASRAVIGFSLDKLARGRGLATTLLQLGFDELARCWGRGIAAYGEVRVENLASCRAFLRACFQESAPPRAGVRCFVRITP